MQSSQAKVAEIVGLNYLHQEKKNFSANSCIDKSILNTVYRKDKKGKQPTHLHAGTIFSRKANSDLSGTFCPCRQHFPRGAPEQPPYTPNPSCLLQVSVWETHMLPPMFLCILHHHLDSLQPCSAACLGYPSSFLREAPIIIFVSVLVMKFHGFLVVIYLKFVFPWAIS